MAKAAVLARDAEGLLSQGKTAEACDKYNESQALDPRGSTALDLALCREKEGRIGSAYLMFDVAERLANQEKRTDRAATAKGKKAALYLKLARVTVNVPKEVAVPGMEVRVGLASDPRGMNLVPESEWGKAFPADTGTVKVVVTAPGKEKWEQTFELKTSARQTVTVAALKDGTSAPPNPTPSDPNPTPADPNQPPPDPSQPPPDPKNPPPPSTPGKHEGGRVVVEIQGLVGGHLSLISQAPLSEINGTEYIYKGELESEFLASCGNTLAVPGAGSCDAKFDPQFGFAGGAQLFLGYAISETFQFGARIFGGVHYPLGFFVSGGPSLSAQVAGPLWLGFTVLVGVSQIEATVVGAKGSIPEGNRADNDGDSQVDIPVEQLAGRSGELPFSEGGATAGAFSGIEVGGSFEVSIVLIDNPSADGSSGALTLSAWPTGLWAPQHGAAVSLPIGLGYRFY